MAATDALAYKGDMRLLRHVLSILVLALAWAQSARAEPVTLLSTPVSHGRSLDIVISACEAEACTLQINLRDGAGVVSTHATGWETPNQTPERGDTAAAREILISAGAPAAAWTLGEEASWTVIAARRVRLAGAREALLLMHMNGFEHVKRTFMLIAAEGGQLRRLWTGGDGLAGPSVSWIEINRRGGAEELIFFRAFLHPDPTDLETLTATRLSVVNGALAETPARDLWAVAAVGYADPAVARQARDTTTGPPLMVLASDMLERRYPEPVVLAAITGFEPRARAWRNEARRGGFPRARLTRANP